MPIFAASFTGSCLLEFPVPVFAAFGSYFCLSKTFTFPRTLRRAEHQNLALSIFTYFFGELILIEQTTKARITEMYLFFKKTNFCPIFRFAIQTFLGG